MSRCLDAAGDRRGSEETDVSPTAKKTATSRPDQATTDLRCSFCGKSAAEVQKLVAGPGVHICDACVTLCVEWIESDSPTAPRAPYLRASAEAAALTGRPTDDVLGLLESRSKAAKGADQDVKDVVAFLRGRGVSWADIGAALGVSRQAAWERFAGEA
jgi:hypothetical protein